MLDPQVCELHPAGEGIYGNYLFRGGESICCAVWCEEPAAAAVRVQFGLGTEQVFPLDGTPSLVLAPRGWGEQSTAWFEVCDADGSEL